MRPVRLRLDQATVW